MLEGEGKGKVLISYVIRGAMLETQCFASPNIGDFFGFWMLFSAI